MKIKDLFFTSYEKLKVSQEFVVTKYKYHLRKLAIKRVKEKLVEMKRVETDFTKDEMRALIQKEEKTLLKDMGTSISLTALLSMFGISTFR